MGYWSSIVGYNAGTTCNACGTGFYFKPGVLTGTSINDCIPCENGKYQSQSGKTLCLECAPGTHSELITKSTKCDGCVVGRFQDQSGQSDCKGCTKGQYINVTGAVTCKDCLPGTIGNADGQLACKNCLQGAFRDGASESLTLCGK